jgi:chromosome segregation ATPase
VADDPARTAENDASGKTQPDEADELRARIATLEADLNKMRSEVSRLNREHRGERRRSRSEGEDRVETIKDIVERVDGEGRRVFRALVLSQLEQMRLTADLVSSFAERIERENPADDPDLERDLPRDVMDGLLETIDRSLEIPEKTIERFDETYKQAPRTRRSRAARSG